MKPDELHPAEQICVIMERVYDMDMTTLTGGNISLMDDNGVMWVTPAGIDKKLLKKEDIVCIMPDGSHVGRYKPTSEYCIHREIYKKRPDIRAVIHAHAPATMTLSILGRAPRTRLCGTVYRITGEPKLTPYEPPGSTRLAERVSDAFAEGFDSVILEKHSSFVGSTVDLPDAYKRFETLDFAAALEINSSITGVPAELTADQLAVKGIMDSGSMEEYPAEGLSADEERLTAVLMAMLKRGSRRRLFTGAVGAMSVRTREDGFIITGNGCDNANPAPEDIIAVRRGRVPCGKLPHNTAVLHEMIYRKHSDIQAVIVASPVYTMGYLVTDKAFRTDLYPESYIVLGEPRRYPYGKILSYEGLEEIADGLGSRHPVAMVEHYGIVLAGSSAVSAYDKLEVCEYSARSMHGCLGMELEPVPMTKSQKEEL